MSWRRQKSQDISDVLGLHFILWRGNVGARARIVGKNYITISSASRDIVGCRQAGDGPARQRDEDTGVDDSCCQCQRRPVSAGDAMNALAVLRDWL